MALDLRFGVSARNAALNAIGALLDGGTVQIRTGSPPTHPANSASGTLLATLTFGTPAFAAAASGSMAANAIMSDISNDASGTAAHFRMLSSAAVCIIQGTVGTSGCDINLDSVTLIILGTCSMSGYTLTLAEA